MKLSNTPPRREIDHADVVFALEADRRFDCGDRFAIGSCPVLIKYAEVDEIPVAAMPLKVCV